MNKSMYCPYCGTENDSTNRFCFNCGEELPDSAEIVSAGETTRRERRPSTPDKRFLSKNWKVIVGLAVGSGLVVAVALIFAGNSSPNPGDGELSTSDDQGGFAPDDQSPVDTQSNSSVDLEVTAEEYHADSENLSDLDFDIKYGGKILRVIGVVGEPPFKDNIGDYRVNLYSSNGSECEHLLPSHDECFDFRPDMPLEEIAQFKVGERVEVICRPSDSPLGARHLCQWDN